MARHPLLQAQLEADEAGHIGYARYLTELVLQEQPEDVPALLAYAHHEISLGQYAAAQSALWRAHSLAPEDRLGFVCVQEGHLLHAQGEFAAAEVTFLAAQELEPDDAHGYTYAAASAFQRGDLARAQELGRLATQCTEGCLDEAWSELAGYLLADDRLAEAAECCARALAILPDDVITLTRLRDIELMQHFRAHAPREQPESVEEVTALVDEAWTSEDAGYSGYARCLSEWLLRHQPENAQALIILAKAQTAQARYANALASIDRLQTLIREEDRPDIFVLQGRLLSQQGRHEAAVAAFLEAHRQEPEEAGHLIFAATSAFHHGDLAQAEALSQKAINCEHGHIDEAWQNLGGYLLSERRYAEAAECYRRALQLESENVFVQARLQDVELIFEHRRGAA